MMDGELERSDYRAIKAKLESEIEHLERGKRSSATVRMRGGLS